jgi:hypothetical protein
VTVTDGIVSLRVDEENLGGDDASHIHNHSQLETTLPRSSEHHRAVSSIIRESAHIERLNVLELELEALPGIELEAREKPSAS